MKYGSFAKHFGRVLVGQEEERGIVTNADGATGGCFEKPSALCNCTHSGDKASPR